MKAILTFYCPAHLSALAASSHKVGTDGGYLAVGTTGVRTIDSKGCLCNGKRFIRAVTAVPVGSLTKRTLPKRHSLSRLNHDPGRG